MLHLLIGEKTNEVLARPAPKRSEANRELPGPLAGPLAGPAPKKSKPNEKSDRPGVDLLSKFYSATKYQPIISTSEKLKAEKFLQEGLEHHDEQTLYRETRELQRQQEYLDLPFTEIVKLFPYLLNVRICICFFLLFSFISL